MVGFWSKEHKSQAIKNYKIRIIIAKHALSIGNNFRKKKLEYALQFIRNNNPLISSQPEYFTLLLPPPWRVTIQRRRFKKLVSFMSLLDHFMLTIPLIIHPSTNYKAARSTIFYHNSHIQPAFAAILPLPPAGRSTGSYKPTHSQRHARDTLQYRSSKGAYKTMHSQRSTRQRYLLVCRYSHIQTMPRFAVLL